MLWNPWLMNPLFINLNPADKDISSFIFRGLMKFESWSIIDDIATHTLSVDKMEYVFTLKKGIKWHDWEDLTIDDVYYTYNDIIKSPDFENKLLQEPFKDVRITKQWSDKIVFTLNKPYKFFLSNLLTWIVPKHILYEVPIKNISISEFNQDPIGLWPYKFDSLRKNWGLVKVSLRKFDQFYWTKPYIDVVELNFYDNRTSLIKDVWSLSAIKPSQEKMQLSNTKTYDFVLNRYVALFFNTKSSFFNNEKVRLGFQLAVNKNDILEYIAEKNLIHMPFFELESENWIFAHDNVKAQWALHENWWQKSSKIVIDNSDTSQLKEKYILSPSEPVIAISDDSMLMKWKVPLSTKEVYINDYQLKKYVQWTTSFVFMAAEKFGNLKQWENNYKLKVKYYSWDEEVLESIKVFYIKDKTKLEEKNIEILAMKKIEEEEVKKKKDEISSKISDVKNSDFRVNNKWEVLKVNLLTDKNISKYIKIAEKLKEQWKEVWIDLVINALDSQALQEAIQKRDYDILLYGQDLWYNLDSYSYWHSSQSVGGLNFSNLSNTQVDVLIEKIRSSHQEKERKENLGLLLK